MTDSFSLKYIRPRKAILTFSPLSRRSAAFRDDFRSVRLQHQCSLDAMHDAFGEAKSRRVDANVQAFRLHLLDFLQHVLFVVIDHFNAQSVPGNVQDGPPSRKCRWHVARPKLGPNARRPVRSVPYPRSRHCRPPSPSPSRMHDTKCLKNDEWRLEKKISSTIPRWSSKNTENQWTFDHEILSEILGFEDQRKFRGKMYSTEITFAFQKPKMKYWMIVKKLNSHLKHFE